MKAMKWLLIAALAYVAIVCAFEGFVSYMGKRQAEHGVAPDEGWLVVTTYDAQDAQAGKDTVVAGVEIDGHLYVAANHWPRNWYNRALANPDIDVLWAGKKAAYRAVPVVDTQRKRVASKYDLPLAIRVLTGFPPRQFLRLDPRQASAR